MSDQKKVTLKNLSQAELERFILSLGEKPFRARQLFRWLYSRGARSYAEMTDLARGFREKLEGRARMTFLEPAEVQEAPDGTKKFRFCLADGEMIETVLLPERGHLTLCISTQAGCRWGCRFCLTGKGGFRRNLEPAEILDQIIAVRTKLKPPDKLTNIVFMGMGEPLENFENVVRAIEIIRSPEGLQISHRRITVSTSGIVPRIEELFSRKNFAKLAVSLNASDDEQRSRLMPVNRKYPMAELLAACRRIPLAHREKITFEYVLLGGVNDTEGDALRLTRLLKGIPAKINLIPFNENPDCAFKRPSEGDVQKFRKVLMDRGFTAIVRQSKGGDIQAACGQLGGRTKRVGELLR